MTAAVRERETVPADVTPAGVDLAVTALLLRAGLHGQDVPSYDEATLKHAIARVARRLTWQPFERAR